MKKIVLKLLILFFASSVLAQNTSIVENEEKSQYENTSYLFVGSITLKPGFHVSAAQSGTFFAKPLGGSESTAPSEQENFFRKETIYKEGITTDDQVIGLASGDKSTSFTYLDGMGREIMGVQVQGNPSQKDIIQPFYYDSKNRPSRSYLPYASTTSDGRYKSNSLTEQAAFYNSPPAGVTGDSKAYSTTIFEDSPLERVLEVTKVGNDFQPKTSSALFKVNTASTVRKWTIYNGLPRSTSYYPAGSLSITESKDEKNAITRTYTDIAGREVLTQVQSGSSTWLNTYYVYSDYGELLFVIPPEAATTYTPNQDYVNAYCFQYQYDEYGREIRSRVPAAKDWSRVIYDQWDRPVLTQDAVQAAKSTKEWSFAKYDIHNRIVVSGIISTDTLESTLRANVAASSVRYELRNTSAIGYTLNRTYPTTATSSNVLAISYYDDYGFLSNSGWDPEGKSFTYSTPSGFSNTKTTGTVKGLETGSKARTTASSTQWLHSVTYYDKYYRPIQTVSGHIKNGTLRTTSQYNFAGETLKTLSQYTGSGGTVNIQRRFTYDHTGRPLKVYHKVNSDAEVLLSEMVYNDMGHLVQTKHHSRNEGNDLLYETDREYTVQGWLKQKTYRYPNGGSDIFSQQMGYQQSLGTGNTARYDGLPSGISWNHAEGDGDQAYNFTYDLAGRLTNAHYKQKNTGTSTWLANNLYNEEGIGYSGNGNITALKRNRNNSGTAVTMDQLVYDYGSSGNQLLSVADNASASYKDGGFKDGNSGSNDFAYNDNGNLTKDLNKGISSITYNRLNLPEKITFGDGSTIQYEYEAGGGLLKETRQLQGEATKTIEYLGELQYENNTLVSIHHDAGKIDAATNKYQYYLTDHLGSTRVVLQEDPQQYTSSATFEQSSYSAESAQFIGYEESAKISEPIFDHTDSGGSSYAMRLSGGNGENIGIARSVSVLPGDTVRMRVFGKYLDLDKKKMNPVVMALASSIKGINVGPGVDGGAVSSAAKNIKNNHPYAGMLGRKNNDGEAPPAYLNYLFFDKNRNFKHGGYVQMSETAYEDGTDRSHEELYQEVVAEEPGYYYIYTSNDSPTASEAFFDDFSVQVAEGPIIQMTDYYPYGLVAENWVREGEEETKELFQGKTLDEKTGWNDFHARQYDAALGRWFAVDPQNQFMSPYLAMGNNPVMMVDPDGEFAFVPLAIAIAKGAMIGAAGASVAYGIKTSIAGTRMTMDGFASSMLKGAISGGAFAGLGNLVAQLTNASGGAAAGGGNVALDGSTSLSGSSMPVRGLGGVGEVGMRDAVSIASQGSSAGVFSNVVNTVTYYGKCTNCIDLPTVTVEALKAYSRADWFKMIASGVNPVVGGFYSAHSGFANNPFGGAILSIPEIVGGEMVLSVAIRGTGAAVRGFEALSRSKELRLVNRAAQKAESAIGGTGRFAGTSKHTYAKNLLSRHQSIYGNKLSLGSNYFNNNALLGPGNRGFLDVVNHGTKTIYDFKFGSATWGPGQLLKYQRNFPGYKIHIIRP